MIRINDEGIIGLGDANATKRITGTSHGSDESANGSVFPVSDTNNAPKHLARMFGVLGLPSSLHSAIPNW